MVDSNSTIQDFLDAAAAKQPAPGGGAVAALAGALAASMGEMVLNYSVTKKDLLQYAQSNQAALKELSNARTMLVSLMVEDQQAYQSMSDAKKSGVTGQPFQEIVLTCVHVPQAIGNTALAILELAVQVVSTSNRWLLSDLAVSGELAMVTVRCAVYNIRVNLPEIMDDQTRSNYEAECQRLINRARRLIQILILKIEAIQSSK